MNYYNEFDPNAAAWLRELIKQGLIADGEVDERSITEVAPKDLEGFTQCHFFAGIRGWSYALRLASWDDERPVWTGSCPCQPFSSAGKGGGVNDERHLWPAFRWLIAQCRPSTVFGEQVAGTSGLGWYSGVRDDLETLGYECGGADLCAASVGAPHVRQRTWWVAKDTAGVGRGRRSDGDTTGGEGEIQNARLRTDGRISNVQRQRLEGQPRHEQIWKKPECQKATRPTSKSLPVDWSRSIWWPCRDGKARRVPSWMGDAESEGLQGCDESRRKDNVNWEDSEVRGSAPGSNKAPSGISDATMHGLASGDGLRKKIESPKPERAEGVGKPSGSGDDTGGMSDCPADDASKHEELVLESEVQRMDNGIPADLDGLWYYCDVESFPLAEKGKGRVALLKGYGNAIVSKVGAEFIMAFMEANAQNYQKPQTKRNQHADH